MRHFERGELPVGCADEPMVATLPPDIIARGCTIVVDRLQNGDPRKFDGDLGKMRRAGAICHGQDQRD
jgi:hypothetical protein